MADGQAASLGRPVYGMMLRYAFNRVLMTIPTFAVVAVAVFVMMRAIPGDPVLMIVGDARDPALIAQIRKEFGLDQPIFVQFMIWFKNMVQFDFGRSLITDEPIATLMLDRFAVTAQVVILAVTISTLIAVPAGMIAAWYQNRRADFILVSAAMICLSVPSFWVGLMLILLFGVKLQLLPIIGYISISEDLGKGILFLILPVAALVFTEIGGILRMVRSSTIDVMRQDYITHARAKGLGDAALLSRHVFVNAFSPTLSLIGWVLGTLLGGAAVIETVFSLPGIGRLLVDSITARDYPVVQAITLFIATIYIIVNLAVDIIYPLLDPRVRL